MKKIQIVLADDDDDDRLLFKEAISQLKLNSELTLVKNGNELMKFLNEPKNTLPDLIFLDLNMPEKSGFQCLSEIRTSSVLNTLSVVIYSTSSSDEDIEECFIRGANIYINKPNDFESLKSVILKVISTNLQYDTSALNKDNFLMII
ncbi:response regulator [Pararhodonellum marinum]|uniref:response regulator n=1 Tax=Pararhodonellum marinum TaxID=2755358 RepID=UPI00188E5ACF|nr:response regulator [Pararhodonellum marinum]